VLGCAVLAGQLNIIATNVTVKILSAPCLNGTFTSIVVSTSRVDSCNPTAAQQYGQGELIVTITFNSCGTPDQPQGFLGSLDYPSSIGVVTLIVFVSAALLVLAILVAIPQLRRKIFPFAHRTRYQFRQTHRPSNRTQ